MDVTRDGSDLPGGATAPTPPAAAASPGWQRRRDTSRTGARRQARRAEIVRAARRVFERIGYFDARVADIVEEADLAQGTFYAYFDSKEAVFREVAQTVLDSMVTAMHGDVSDDATPYERIEAAMRRFVAAYRPNARIIALCEQVGGVSPTLRDLRLAMREAFVVRSERGIARQQANGVADPSMDPRLAAEVLGAMVDYTCYVWFNLGRQFDEQQLIATLTRVWARALEIAAPQPPADERHR